MIAVIDYGIGNTRSIQNALEYLGYNSILTRNVKEIELSDAIILPGVGAFGEGMSRIEKYSLRPIFQSALKRNKPILGICLGFQLFMRSSNEMGMNEGLSFFPLDVVSLPVNDRLPHIGWANVHSVNKGEYKKLKLMQGVEGEQFYFVHSYGVEASKSIIPHAVAHYGSCEIIAAIEHKNIFGTQFHPEKSGEVGLHLLRNFVEAAI